MKVELGHYICTLREQATGLEEVSVGGYRTRSAWTWWALYDFDECRQDEREMVDN